MSHSVASPAASGPTEPPVRHGRLQKAHPFVAILKFLAIAVAVVAVSAASVFSVAVYSLASDLKAPIHLQHLAGSKVEKAPAVGAIDGEVNILLAGSDTRTGQTGYQSKAELAGSSGLGNNDVTMLLHVSADHTSATVVSFPRDLVEVPICGGSSSTAMFNSTLSRGLSCTVQTVEKMTGLTIPYAGVITFDGVIGMSNAVGGVTVCLATAVHDAYTNPQLDLAAGQQTLVGSTALSFLRSRHGVGDGSDLGRISNQQVFLSALVRRITSEGVLSNPITMFKLADAALSNIQLSDTLTNPTSLVSIALTLKGIPLTNIVFLQYPVVSDPADPNRVVANTSAALALKAALNSNSPIALTGKTGVGAELDPSSTPTPTVAPSTSATASPTATPSPSSTTIQLPSSITGQSASQDTCTKGNR